MYGKKSCGKIKISISPSPSRPCKLTLPLITYVMTPSHLISPLTYLVIIKFMSHIGSEMITLHNNRTVSHTLLHSTFLLFYPLWTNWTTLKVYCKLLPTLNFSIKSFTPPPLQKIWNSLVPTPYFFPSPPSTYLMTGPQVRSQILSTIIQVIKNIGQLQNTSLIYQSQVMQSWSPAAS